ncbi:Hypothetical protein FKW44_017496 [Caligus rogercresseyi]|uniref:Uncharacterized protein n=1 Tax=Caligus rogercresseyi TaxID=217165 RepID=A0A7T8GT11_CALRO|nr:Hypothetical protein FKW44_017496 [Caligus rogercresseyi]
MKRKEDLKTQETKMRRLQFQIWILNKEWFVQSPLYAKRGTNEKTDYHRTRKGKKQ